MSELAVDAASVFTTAPGVYARAFGEELVLLHFATGDYFGLDPVGAEVWRGVEAGRALGPIANQIAETWDVEESRALSDIVTVVREMCDQGLLIPR